MTLDKAAYRASFSIVGVKDQRCINLMVADSLKKYRDRYIAERYRIRDPEAVIVLDKHHDYKPNNCPRCGQ